VSYRWARADVKEEDEGIECEDLCDMCEFIFGGKQTIINLILSGE
jgi:hypothetical protein